MNDGSGKKGFDSNLERSEGTLKYWVETRMQMGS